jgi:type I restriction enzyme S subunit
MSEWQKGNLGEFINLKRGYDLPSKSRVFGEFPIISSSGITDYHNEPKVFEGGVITGRYGTIGQVFYTDKPFHPLNTTLYVQDFKDNNKKFVYYFLKELDWEKFSDKSAVPGINRNDVHQEIVSFPPLPEQQAIASVLSSLDDKIDLLHRQNKTLEQMAETLFRQWFIEEAKEYWEEADLTQLITLKSGFAFKSKDFRQFGENGIIKIKNISNSIIDINNTDYIDNEIAIKILDSFKLNEGNILIAMTGAEIGKLGLIPRTNKKLFLNQRVGILNPKFEGADIIAYLYLKSDIGQDYIGNTATGSAQPNISATGIEKCNFPKIDVDILKEYGKDLKIYFNKIIENLGQIQTLENLRDTLLPKLMSGEIRVQH